MAKKVESRARFRDGPVTAASFNKKAARSLTFTFNDKAASDSKSAVRGWNKFIPVTPAAAARMLLEDLPETAKVKLELNKDGSGDVSIAADGIFSDKRDFDLKGHFLNAGNISVQDAYKDKGYGRTIMRNLVEFFHACGARKFTIFASGTNGGYTWARLGFVPSGDKEKEWGNARDKAQERFDLLKKFIPRRERKLVQDALEDESAKGIWGVADLRFDMTPVLAEIYRKAKDESLPPEQREKFGKIKQEVESNFHLGVDIEEFAAKGKPLPLGRVLLTWADWDGQMNFDDAKQMERVGAYVGGWRHLKIQ